MAPSLVGMKCAILLNRSNTTMIASNPLDGAKLLQPYSGARDQGKGLQGCEPRKEAWE